MDNNNMDLTNNEIFIFKLGIAAGRQQLADYIQHQFEIAMPVAVNDELYWLKDAKQNLQDIMDDIENAWNEEHGLSKFIVPIKKCGYDNKEIVREVIIQADRAEMARVIAVGDFQHDGWIIDMDCQHYKQLKE